MLNLVPFESVQHNDLCNLVRQSSTDLALCVCRQKQVTVGLPPAREVIISRPLGAQELKKLIGKAHEGDLSTSSLSQVRTVRRTGKLAHILTFLPNYCVNLLLCFCLVQC